MAICDCGRKTVRRSGGQWCTYCHRTLYPPDRRPRDEKGRLVKVYTDEELKARRKASKKRWIANNRERHLAYRRSRSDKDREAQRRSHRVWRERNKERLREKARQRHANMTPEQRERYLEKKRQSYANRQANKRS